MQMQAIKEQTKTVLRFCIVGAGNTFIDFGVFFLLATAGAPYLLAQVVSYMAGMANSYIWNRIWTFQVKKKVNRQEMLRFITINAAAVGAAFFLLYLLKETGHVPLFLGKIMATLGGMAITLIGSRLWVFQNPMDQKEA
ncbi:GtrA family protein [Anoxybacteroides rupiense]|uniref:GtrA family protein n=1 Tax=Anoxybacteroides rupiense TaxID=311460 RepID=UPI00366FB0A8